MSKDPAVLFYTSDFLTGTTLMSNEQVGKYIRLLCLQHQRGILTEKDMLKICQSYDEDIYEKFVKTDEGYFNQRMREEFDKRKNYSASRSNNRKGKKDMNNISKSYDKHMENENENESANLKESKKDRFVKPTLDELKDYMLSIDMLDISNKFFDFYESKGWLIGKNKMKDWKSAVRTWKPNNLQQAQVVYNKPKAYNPSNYE
jgi:uncharacterized protein YdaU (DUF1376 family)